MPGPAKRRGEFETIAALFRPLTRGSRAALDLADDVACLRPPPGRDLIVTADQLVVGVHTRGGEPAERVARKALRRNLSDLAAKGATPVGYLLTLARPRSISDRWLDGFARGLAADGKRYGIPLIGGDTTSTPGPFAVSITALGEVPAGTMVPRDGAKPGDALWVTGTIGDAALGLDALAKGRAPAFLRRRYELPEPRLEFGLGLRGLARAAIDVSDGLIADLGHLARASRVAAVLDAEAVPLSTHARRAGDLARALTGGDDYEILFAAPPDASGRIAALAKRARVRATRIGTIRKGVAGHIDIRGMPGLGARAGFTHF